MALRLCTIPEWTTLFQQLGITDNTTSTAYATSFVEGSIPEVTLPYLDKSTFTDLGITVIGHRITILTEIKTMTTEAPAMSTKATVNAKLTTLTSDMTQSQFRQSENDGKVYKQLVHLQPQQHVPYI